MRPFILLATLTLTVSAQTEAPTLESLVSNSPFGTASQAANPSAAATPLEFRGTFVDGGERFFSIMDTGSRRAEWVSMNETDRPFVVRNYNGESETITVDHQGRTLNLKLHSARIGVLPPMQAGQASAGQPQQQPSASPTTAAPNASEAQRLAQVAEEIRRRRALRQQSANPVNAQPNSPPPR